MNNSARSWPTRLRRTVLTTSGEELLQAGPGSASASLLRLSLLSPLRQPSPSSGSPASPSFQGAPWGHPRAGHLSAALTPRALHWSPGPSALPCSGQGAQGPPGQPDLLQAPGEASPDEPTALCSARPGGCRLAVRPRSMADAVLPLQSSASAPRVHRPSPRQAGLVRVTNLDVSRPELQKLASKPGHTHITG